MVERNPAASHSAKLRILVVEDEGMIAMLIEDMLIQLGHEVVAVASNARQALEVARTASFDFALVDLNLDGQPSYPIADMLASRGAPFAFATGYGLQGVDRRYADVPRLTKPFLSSDLDQLLSQVVPRGTTGG
ncbi:MAG TPA: response regulator [Roseiarcus sp.]